jgi:hypothetical protein
MPVWWRTSWTSCCPAASELGPAYSAAGTTTLLTPTSIATTEGNNTTR